MLHNCCSKSKWASCWTLGLLRFQINLWVINLEPAIIFSKDLFIYDSCDIMLNIQPRSEHVSACRLPSCVEHPRSFQYGVLFKVFLYPRPSTASRHFVLQSGKMRDGKVSCLKVTCKFVVPGLEPGSRTLQSGAISPARAGSILQHLSFSWGPRLGLLYDPCRCLTQWGRPNTDSVPSVLPQCSSHRSSHWPVKEGPRTPHPVCEETEVQRGQGVCPGTTAGWKCVNPRAHPNQCGCPLLPRTPRQGFSSDLG